MGEVRNMDKGDILMNIVEGFSGNIGELIPLYNEKNLPRYEKMLFFNMLLFEYYSCPREALIFTGRDGTQYQLDRHFETDGGSIPSIAQAVPLLKLNPFDFLRSYLYHDCAFIYGGLYIKYQGEEDFKFRLLTRSESNDLLNDMLPFDGASWLDRNIIVGVVKTGSKFIWDSKKSTLQKINRDKNNIRVYDKPGNLTNLQFSP